MDAYIRIHIYICIVYVYTLLIKENIKNWFNVGESTKEKKPKQLRQRRNNVTKRFKMFTFTF